MKNDTSGAGNGDDAGSFALSEGEAVSDTKFGAVEAALGPEPRPREAGLGVAVWP